MRQQITKSWKVGLVAAIGLFAVIGVAMALITTSISNVQADPPHHHHYALPLPNGKPYNGNKNGCPPGLEN